MNAVKVLTNLKNYKLVLYTSMGRCTRYKVNRGSTGVGIANGTYIEHDLLQNV